ncbi:MAG: hypothetical protein AMJ78_00795 [Omnitrophica WOR_2 bacterium SM23_29]|nr:MAG: hypothetical protein AMJ78_00795 [Omnitrophica WOR_2 bacterium SM23_29]
MRRSQEHQIYELLNNTFKDIALCLGGIFLTHKTDDKLIWEIASSIEDIYYKSMDRLETILGSGIIFDLKDDKKSLHPHPAIEDLLKTINFKPGTMKTK